MALVEASGKTVNEGADKLKHGLEDQADASRELD
jgi:hypothetical protein